MLPTTTWSSPPTVSRPSPQAEAPDVFRPNIDVGSNRFIWLGSRRKLDAFTFDFRETAWGWFILHAYRFDADMSTFIVETPEGNWRAAGIDPMDATESIALCESLFADRLDGNRLISNATHLRGPAVWLRFQRVLCERWYHENIVLIGDAAHTAHFSIGSGTKLAMEDAMAFAACPRPNAGDIATALEQYQAEREIGAAQAAERGPQPDGVVRARRPLRPPRARAVHLQPAHRQPADRARESQAARPWLCGAVESWFAARSGVDASRAADVHPVLRRAGSRSRTASLCSPMAIYMGEDGVPNDFHLVHFGARAMGGAAMVFTEMTCVSPEARITPGCLGLWNDEQRDAWTRIVDYVHTQTDAKIALQLGHSGRKGSTRRGWEGIDQPLHRDNWPLVSASAIPYIDGLSQTPCEATCADLDQISTDFVAATRRGRRRPASIGSSCTARTGTCCPVSSRLSPICAPIASAGHWKTGAGSHSKSSTRCAMCGPTTNP